MSTLHSALSVLTQSDMHLCLYGAFGAILLLRSFLAARDHHYDVACEDAVIGLVHILLAML